jgi:hypothetical protein
MSIVRFTSENKGLIVIAKEVLEENIVEVVSEFILCICSPSRSLQQMKQEVIKCSRWLLPLLDTTFSFSTTYFFDGHKCTHREIFVWSYHLHYYLKDFKRHASFNMRSNHFIWEDGQELPVSQNWFKEVVRNCSYLYRWRPASQRNPVGCTHSLIGSSLSWQNKYS